MRRGRLAVVAFSILVAVTGAWSVASGGPLPPLVSVEHENCLIFIGARGYDLESELGRELAAVDVLRVKAELENALMKSADMRAKVVEACDASGVGEPPAKRRLNVYVGRNVPGVAIGVANPASAGNPGNFVLDLTDITNVANHFQPGSDPGLVRTVAKNYLIRTIAHEMDHLRDGPEVWGRGGNHADPAGDSAERLTGAPVDDANQVLSELGEVDRRTQYGGNLIGFAGDGTGAVLDFKAIYDIGNVAVRQSGRGSGRTRIGDPEDFLESIPSRPCLHEDEAGCWALPFETDYDLDGVTDVEDACPMLANPQQRPGDCEDESEDEDPVEMPPDEEDPDGMDPGNEDPGDA